MLRSSSQTLQRSNCDSISAKFHSSSRKVTRFAGAESKGTLQGHESCVSILVVITGVNFH